jgi:hypothetical protein
LKPHFFMLKFGLNEVGLAEKEGQYQAGLGIKNE